MIYDAIEFENGEILYLEAPYGGDSQEGPVQASLSDIVRKSGLNLSNEAAKIGRFMKDLRQGMLESLTEAQPSKMELEVGLDFSHNLGCMMIGSTVGSQFKIKMTWEIEK